MMLFHNGSKELRKQQNQLLSITTRSISMIPITLLLLLAFRRPPIVIEASSSSIDPFIRRRKMKRTIEKWNHQFSIIDGNDATNSRRTERRRLPPTFVSFHPMERHNQPHHCVDVAFLIRGGADSYGISDDSVAVVVGNDRNDTIDNDLSSDHTSSLNSNRTSSIADDNQNRIRGNESNINNQPALEVVDGSGTSRNMSSSSSWRQSMPDNLQRKGPKTFQKLHLGSDCIIYLLGTAHISNDSSIDVQKLLQHVQPDCIFVELCNSRTSLLESNDTNNNDVAAVVEGDNSTSSSTNKNEQQPKLTLREKIRATRATQGGSYVQALSSVLLSSVQEDYAESLGVELGGEFRCAHQYWKQRQQQLQQNKPQSSDCCLILGDRPVQITLIRAWESLNWMTKIKVVLGLLYTSILQKPDKDELKQWLLSAMEYESDVITQSMQELRQHFPTLYTTIINERDMWLAAKLVQTCRILSVSSFKSSTTTSYYDEDSSNFINNNNDSIVGQQQATTTTKPIVIVAIVGAGHVPGICQQLTSTTSSTEQYDNDEKMNESPEQVLTKLVQTKKWSHDVYRQQHVIPSLINDVVQLTYHD